MSDENEEIAPLYSFKPIDGDMPLLDNSISNDSLLSEDGGLPTSIFREVSNSATTERQLPMASQSSSMGLTSGAVVTDVEMAADRHVISPYPFSHASQEEIEDREQLSAVFNWALESSSTLDCNPHSSKMHFQFENAESLDGAMDCDDFSVESEVSDNLCLDSISDNPSSFWGDCTNEMAYTQNENSAAS